MTAVYFVRHAQSDRFFREDRTRPLTAEGLADSEKVTAALSDKRISHILSSPYTRTLQTVEGLAKALGLDVETDEDFRERDAGIWHGDDFKQFIERQWADFSYRAEGGESLSQVQRRNVAALRRAVEKYSGGNIVIATHGTALSTILNHFRPEFGFRDFMRIIDFMPYVVRVDIDPDGKCAGFEEILIVRRPYK